MDFLVFLDDFSFLPLDLALVLWYLKIWYIFYSGVRVTVGYTISCMSTRFLKPGAYKHSYFLGDFKICAHLVF